MSIRDDGIGMLLEPLSELGLVPERDTQGNALTRSLQYADLAALYRDGF